MCPVAFWVFTRVLPSARSTILLAMLPRNPVSSSYTCQLQAVSFGRSSLTLPSRPMGLVPNDLLTLGPPAGWEPLGQKGQASTLPGRLPTI